MPFTRRLEAAGPWPVKHANLTFLANPNSPSGTTISSPEIVRLRGSIDGPLVVDEAYADFADGHSP